jgi:hypothetical protein
MQRVVSQNVWKLASKKYSWCLAMQKMQRCVWLKYLVCMKYFNLLCALTGPRMTSTCNYTHWQCGVLYVLVWGSERARGCWECGSEDGGHSGSYLERERFSSSFQIVVLSVRRNTTLYKDLTPIATNNGYGQKKFHRDLTKIWFFGSPRKKAKRHKVLSRTRARFQTLGRYCMYQIFPENSRCFSFVNVNKEPQL